MPKLLSEILHLVPGDMRGYLLKPLKENTCQLKAQRLKSCGGQTQILMTTGHMTTDLKQSMKRQVIAKQRLIGGQYIHNRVSVSVCVCIVTAAKHEYFQVYLTARV